MTPDSDLPGRLRATAGAAFLVAAVSLLPFVRGILAGASFYFRDLALFFFPQRRFAVEGLRALEVRYWNPFTHEGTPTFPPPVSYPGDLLQVLWPHEAGLSLVLALHVPLAAVAFLLMGRELGLPRRAAAGGALIYALGGFALSTLNLYVHLQAVAWSPLVILGLHRLREGGRRQVALASLLVGVAVSTTGIEVVAQAVLVGLVLAALPTRGFWVRALSSLGLGVGLSAVTVLTVGGQATSESARAAGFPTAVALSHSLHPLTLLQALIGNLHGDLGRLSEVWWGMNFFPRGFPYFLSLYLGAAALALAAVGSGRGPRRLVLVALLAVFVCLGQWAGLESLVDHVPWLRRFRYPAKAFFTVHLAVAILSAQGLAALAGGRRWRRFCLVGAALGVALAGLPLIPGAFPAATRWFAAGFFPPDYSWPLRFERLAAVAADARQGGLVALVAAVVAGAVLARRLAPATAATALAGLVAADLLRSGAGLNPMVEPAFFRPSSSMQAVAAELRAEGGRIFSLDPEASPAYARARRQRGQDHERWTFATLMELQVPEFNLAQRLPSALSLDRTMMTPVSRVLPPEQAGPRSFAELLPRLRQAGVAHVLSLDLLHHPDLELRREVRSLRLMPLSVRVYRLRHPRPLRAVARDVRPPPPGATPPERNAALLDADATVVEGGLTATTGASGRVLESREASDRIEMTVEADRPTVVVVRDAFAPGWSATVNGSPAPVLRAEGRYRAVPVAAGLSRVILAYRPPGLAAGLFLTLASAAVTAWLARPARGSAAGPAPAPRAPAA